MIRSILGNVRVSSDGHAYLENYADLIVDLSSLDPFERSTVFLQLATLATHHAERSDRRALARCLAHLARIGLVPLASGKSAPRSRLQSSRGAVDG
jgi:hypothetical protein